MFRYQKGHMKELPIADGTLMLASTFNPMKLDPKEREFFFAMVDMMREFESRQLLERGPNEQETL